MLKKPADPILKIIDANLNSTREGLRVCEDISRFIISDKDITRALKLIRHTATKIMLNSKTLKLKHLLQNRDTENDAAKFFDLKKPKNISIADIFMSNIQRVKESLRVVEECCKIIDEGISRRYRKLRFNTYDIEKASVKKIRHISGNR